MRCTPQSVATRRGARHNTACSTACCRLHGLCRMLDEACWMLRPAARRVALCNTGCSKLQGDVLHVAARRVAACNITRCRLQFRLLQVVARIGSGCWLSGCTLQHRALQVATRRVARCNTRAWCAQCMHHVCCAQHDATPHVAFLSRHAPCVAGATFDAPALAHPSTRAAQRLLLATATPTAAPGAPSRSSQRSRPLHGRARRRRSAAPRRSAGCRCTRVCGLRRGVQSTASASARTPSPAPPTAPRPRARSVHVARTTAARCPTCSTG